MTGSGFPQRFADTDGSLIDVYQAMTQLPDELSVDLGKNMPAFAHTLLDNALGSKGYYGAFTINAHTDYPDHSNAEDIVAEAQERGVPVVSAKQMLDWLDARSASAFRNISRSGAQVSFTIDQAANARGLEAMLPIAGSTGPLEKITVAGTPVSWNVRTVKGVDYAVFNSAPGAYVATYETDTTAPPISGVSATADNEGNATVKWTTDEPSTSQVRYGFSRQRADAADERHGARDRPQITLSGLLPGATYYYKVTSQDAVGNSATSPVSSFGVAPGHVVDSSAADFTAGSDSNTISAGRGPLPTARCS